MSTTADVVSADSEEAPWLPVTRPTQPSLIEKAKTSPTESAFWSEVRSEGQRLLTAVQPLGSLTTVPPANKTAFGKQAGTITWKQGLVWKSESTDCSCLNEQRWSTTVIHAHPHEPTPEQWYLTPTCAVKCTCLLLRPHATSEHVTLQIKQHHLIPNESMGAALTPVRAAAERNG